ncbi:MAG: hypothetical protein U1F57_09025 [bacterium]
MVAYGTSTPELSVNVLAVPAKFGYSGGKRGG